MEGTAKERFLGFMKTNFDAASMNTAIENLLVEKGIDQLKYVAQTYDGVTVMSGPVGGVQDHFRKQHLEVIYVHCYVHELNLVLCHTWSMVSEGTEFFALLESVHSFFVNGL